MNGKKLLDELEFDFEQDSDILGSLGEDSLFDRMTSKPLSDNSGNELKPISLSNSINDSSSDFTVSSIFDGYPTQNVYDSAPYTKKEKIPLITKLEGPINYTSNNRNTINNINTISTHPETSLPTKPTFLSEPKHLSQNINSINIPSTINNNRNSEEIKKYKEDIENYEMRLKEYEDSIERLQNELNEYKTKETQWNIKEAELENNIREKDSIINELKSENSNQALTQVQLEKEKENSLLTKELQYNKEIEEIKSKYESQINQLQTEIRIKEFEYKNELNSQKQEYEQQILELQNRCTNEINIQSNDNEMDIEYQAKLHELEEKNNEIECELCKMKIEYDNKVNEIAHLKNKVNNNEINYSIYHYNLL